MSHATVHFSLEPKFSEPNSTTATIALETVPTIKPGMLIILYLHPRLVRYLFLHWAH